LNTVNEKLVIHSGKSIPMAGGKGAPKSCLTRAELRTIHLMPTADPVCYTKNADGSLKFYFSPDNVTVTPAEIWYSDKRSDHESLYELPDGSLIPLMDRYDAETLGLFTADHLHDLHLTIVESPCAFYVINEDNYEDSEYEDEYDEYDDDSEDTDTEYHGTQEGRENSHLFPYNDGDKIFLYDIRTCKRNPLKCTRCGIGERFKNKLCRSCYEKDMLIRRKAGDAYRASVKGIDRGKAIFFDLELTGVYPYDEIISVSITDGFGNEIMDTLVRPEKRKQWNTTVKIHGITPAMVQTAPYLREIAPKIKAILLNAQIIVAYGISTDYAHIKKIFTDKEQKILEKKLRCCSKEYVRYISEYEPDINRSALVAAMEYFKIEWTGSAHTSMADTHACRFVWERLFPSCYTQSGDEDPVKTEIISLIEKMPKTRSLTFDQGYSLANKRAHCERRPAEPRTKLAAQSSAIGSGDDDDDFGGISAGTNTILFDRADDTDRMRTEEERMLSEAGGRNRADGESADGSKVEQKKRGGFFASFFKSKKE